MALDSVSNDYESFDMVLEMVTEMASEDHLRFAPSEIKATLNSLIEVGQVVAYRLSSTSAPEVLTSVNLDDLPEDTYFLITPEGRQAGARLAELWPKKSAGDSVR